MGNVVSSVAYKSLVQLQRTGITTLEPEALRTQSTSANIYLPTSNSKLSTTLGPSVRTRFDVVGPLSCRDHFQDPWARAAPVLVNCQ